MMEIKINDEIVGKIKSRLEGSEFSTVEEYINYVLKELVSEEGEEKPAEQKSEQVYSKEDEEKIKERLRGLGYIE